MINKGLYKLVFTLSLMFLFSASIHAQEIEVSGIFGSSSSKEFSSNTGMSFGYYHFIHDSRLGISFSYTSNKNEYNEITDSPNDPDLKYIARYKPNNKRSTVNLNYAYTLVDNERSKLFVGANLGLCNYSMAGTYNQLAMDTIPAGEFNYNFTQRNKLALGLLLDYELTNVIFKYFSTSIKIHPELLAYNSQILPGNNEAQIIKWMGFELALKYNFRGN